MPSSWILGGPTFKGKERSRKGRAREKRGGAKGVGAGREGKGQNGKGERKGRETRPPIEISGYATADYFIDERMHECPYTLRFDL